MNLAGDPNCDEKIRAVFHSVGINAVPLEGKELEEQARREVPYTIIGKLGSFEFRGGWAFWRVQGFMPYAVAVELWNHPLGRQDIRVEGHIGRPHPDEFGSGWYTPDRKIIIPTEEWNEASKSKSIMKFLEKEYVAHDAPETIGERFVTYYDIDSLAGLLLFVETIKKHGLA